MYIFFDTETTGKAQNFKAPWSDTSNWPRMVQIAWMEFNKEGEKTAEFNYIIKPDGFTIPMEAIQIHRISNERANEEGVDLKFVLEKFQEALLRNHYLVAHNIDFDLGVTGCEFIRLGLQNNLSKIYPIDTMKQTINFCQLKGFRKGVYKFPQLAELYFKLFNRAFQGAHDALVDVKAMADCFFELQRINVFGFKDIPDNVIKSFSSNVVTETVLTPKEASKPFVHFSLHTFYSILNGASSVQQYINRAKKLNHDTVCIVDTQSLSGSLDMYLKCKKNGLKFICGVEFNLNETINPEDRSKENNSNFLVKVLIKNEQGYKNANKLLYLSHTDGFDNGIPRIKTSWLLENKEGLVVTTGDYRSLMADHISNGNKHLASEYWHILNNEFGDDFITEIKFFEMDIQKRYNDFLLKMALDNKKMVILDNDVHYAEEEDKDMQDLVTAISQGRAMKDCRLSERRNLFYLDRFDYLKLNKRFSYNYPDNVLEIFMDNTVKLAERFNFEFKLGAENYPKYEPEQDIIDYFKTSDTNEIITQMANAKLNQKLNRRRKSGKYVINDDVVKTYQDRLNYELEVIKSKKISDYFLVNWELLRDYRKQGYETGSARGCFHPKMRVKMSDGALKELDQIQVGELVLDAYNDPRKVENVFVYDADEDLLEILFDNNISIICTKQHEFLTENRSWIAAEDLCEEDDVVYF